MSNLFWVDNPVKLANQPPTPIIDWLTKPDILSQALKRVCRQFNVELIAEQLGDAYPDEVLALGMDEQEAFIRQVFLVGDGVRLTYGRVVIPKPTYQHFLAEFTGLKNNLIGETLLYPNPHVSKRSFQYAQLVPTDALAKEVDGQQMLWAHRRVFDNGAFPLLVTTVFLPNLPDFHE